MGIGAKECFSVLSSGIIVSINSKENREIAHFLSIEDNFSEFDETVSKIGFKLFGENGYFYMSRQENLSGVELDRFIDRHRKVFQSLSVLKKLFPSLNQSQTVKKSDFTAKYKENEDLQKMAEKIFKESDFENIKENIFKVLQKGGVLEQIANTQKDEYQVLNSIKYYMNILERI